MAARSGAKGAAAHWCRSTTSPSPTWLVHLQGARGPRQKIPRLDLMVTDYHGVMPSSQSETLLVGRGLSMILGAEVVGMDPVKLLHHQKGQSTRL